MSARDIGFHRTMSAAGHSSDMQRVYVTGMAIALCGVGLFFAALLSAWVVRKGLAGAPEFPLDLPGRLLGANTFVLLLSSATLETARRRLRAASNGAFRRWWHTTTALGVLFLAGQLMAWRIMAAQGIFLASSADASFFYLLSAAHGVHLLSGIAGLLAVALWPLRRMTLATAANVAAMYWHFLAAIWTCIIVLLTVFRS